MSWTPGPWRIEQPHHDRAYVMSEQDRTVAVADGQNFEADARLIKEAPEMVDALHDVVYGHTIGSFERARALLARIRGEA